MRFFPKKIQFLNFEKVEFLSARTGAIFAERVHIWILYEILYENQYK